MHEICYVVIPNWNGIDLIEECLEALRKQTQSHKVIVVDNGSSDGSNDLVRTHYPEVRLIEFGDNAGFAGGVNRGIRPAIAEGADYIVLLNNDAVADSKWLERLVEHAKDRPDTGIITSKILSFDGSHIDSTGDFYTCWGFSYPRGRGEADLGQYDAPELQSVFAGSGGASLYRADMLKKIGLFDERFFAYFEDVDISFRAQLAGWKVRYEPTATVHHRISATSSRMPSNFTRYHTLKNFTYVYTKNMPGRLYVKNLPRFFAALWLMAANDLTRGKFATTLRASLTALAFTPAMVVSRVKIQRARKVPISYIDSMLEKRLPPIQRARLKTLPGVKLIPRRWLASRPKRIVIDAYQMRHAITGTDRQARNILRELQAMDQENEYIVVVNRDEPFVSDIITGANFRLYPVHFSRRASWIYIGLPLLLLRLRTDVFYSFHNLTAPGIAIRPTVASALDLIPFIYQKRYYQGFLDYWVRRPLVLGYMKNAARTATAFWTISEFTKHEMATFFDIPEERFHVAYMEADPVFKEVPSQEQVDELHKKLGVESGFVYTIGGAEPRKNNLMLIAAHRRLPQEIRKKHPLVIAGARWQGEDLTNAKDPHVILAGYVSDQMHAVLYHDAAVFVCASQYEGFGLPVLEAMASGTPVISSNATSLPEVMGEAGLLFDPSSEEQLYKALHKILQDDKLRAQLAKAGLERASQFSWKQPAKVIHDLILGAAEKI